MTPDKDKLREAVIEAAVAHVVNRSWNSQSYKTLYEAVEAMTRKPSIGEAVAKEFNDSVGRPDGWPSTSKYNVSIEGAGQRGAEIAIEQAKEIIRSNSWNASTNTTAKKVFAELDALVAKQEQP